MRAWTLLLVFGSAAALLAESAAGLRWTAPAGWKSQPAQPLRAATYRVPPAPGDKEDAECGVYFFGAGQGGSVEANIDRWKGQFHGPKGAPAQGVVTKRLVNGLAVTRIDASGDYSGTGGPLAAQVSVKSGYRLLGAIVVGPGGNIFIKFTGPAKTVAANRRKFEQFVGSFAPDK